MSTSSQNIKCPNCGQLISIDDVLTHQFEEKYKQRELEIVKQRQELQEATKNSQIEINKKVEEKLQLEKLEMWKKAQVAAQKEQESSKAILELQLKEKDEKLKKASDAELALRLEKNKLQDEKNNFELDKQRQLDSERAKIQEEASKKAAEAEQYKIAQLEKKINDNYKIIEEQKRKLDQGSQQTQGEVVELELEQLLKTTFIYDQIVPVPKGVSGADIVQKVYSKNGRLCGQIIWEIKKTKLWTEGWIAKLKDDQRAIKADLAVIISAALPDGTTGFSQRDGVWVCEIRLALALASALRLNLEAVSQEKSLSVGKNEKAEVLYTYLTSIQFKQRVESIVETFTSMQQDLQKEKIAFQSMWAKREQQMQKVINSTVGMYGDISGLAPIQKIDLLEFPKEDQPKLL